MRDANRIRMFRERTGKSRDAVARELGVSLGAVVGWENGKEPTGGNLVRLADCLGVEPRELLAPAEPTGPEAA